MGTGRSGPPPPDFLPYLADTVARSGLTLRQLAAWAGVHHTSLSRLVRGRQAVTPQVLVALAPALGVGVGELLERAGFAPPEAQLDLRALGLELVLPYAVLEQELDRLVAEAAQPGAARAAAVGYRRRRSGAALTGPVAEHLDRLYLLSRDPRIGARGRALARAAVLYFVRESDRVPDHLLAVGLVDDAWMIERVWREVGPLVAAGPEDGRTRGGGRQRARGSVPQADP